MMFRDNRRLDYVLGLAAACLLLVPWYRVRSGFFGLDWVPDLPGRQDLWPGLMQIAAGRWQVAPILVLVLLAVFLRLGTAPGRRRGGRLALIGVAGLAWMVAEGMSIGLRGWNWTLLETALGEVDGQPAFGAGAVGLAMVFTLFIAFGLTERGALKGDAFVTGSIALLVLLVATFVFYPILSMFTGAFQDFDGSFTAAGVLKNVPDP